MGVWGTVTTVLIALATSSTAQSAPYHLYPTHSRVQNNEGAAFIPVVVFSRDGRQTAEDFAKDHHLDASDVRREQSASGLIVCGSAHGAGQLTLANDVITTAAHVFFDETGKSRGPSCDFEINVNGQAMKIPVDLSTIAAGSTNPYAVDPVHDWAVAHLARRVTGVTPYTLATAIQAEVPITFVAHGHSDWGGGTKLSLEECHLHDQIATAPGGTREFSFDCDTGDGASGGALMFDKERSQIGAVLVGWLSNHPHGHIPFCNTHYNFAVTIEGEFRHAVVAAANSMMVEK